MKSGNNLRIAICFLFIGLFYLVGSQFAYAQSFRGTDFWFGYLSNSDGAGLDFQVHIVSDVNTSGTLSIPQQPGVAPFNFTVTAGIVTTLLVNPNLTHHQANVAGIEETVLPRGVHIVTNDPCVVYIGNYKPYSSDAATAIPTPSLGNLYHIITYGGVEGLGPAEFLLVGTEDGTIVNISTTAGTVSRPVRGGTSWNITLNKGETYHVQTSALIYLVPPEPETDLIGSVVTSSKPIAVYSGNECTFVGGCPACDHLFEQIRPLNTWGYQYFSASTAKAAIGTQDILRVYSPQAGTTFTFNGAPFILGANAFQEFRVNGPFYINSNNPIHVSQYLTGSLCATPPLAIDPLMMDIIGIEQYANEYVFGTSPYIRYGIHFATILIEDAEKNNLRLNSVAPTPIDPLTGLATSWLPIPGTAYVYGYLELTGGASYTIRTTSSAAFGLYVYGYGEEESYGYTAGGNLSNLCKLNVSDKGVCQGDEAILTVSSDFVDLESEFKWYKNPTGGPVLYTGTNYNVGVLAATDSFYVQLDNRACDNSRQKVKVTVVPKPTSTFTVTPASVCANEELSLAYTGTYDLAKPVIFGWNVDGGTPVPLNTAGPHLVKWSTPSVKNVSLTITQTGCSSLITSKTVTVNPIPPTPLANDVSVCEGANATLTASNVPGATYEWTGPNGYTSSVQSPTISSTTAAMSGTYTVKVKLNGCYSIPKSIILTVTPRPEQPIISINPANICEGQTMTLGTSNIPAYSAVTVYAWTGPSAYASSLASPSITNMDNTKQGMYRLRVSVNGCTSLFGDRSVIVSPTPATPVALEDGPYCAGSAINLSIDNPIVGAMYNWTGPGGYTSSAQNPTRSNSTTAMSGTYNVTVTENGCVSGIASVNVVVNPIPATPTATANSPICVGGTLQLNTPTVNNATYSWIGPGGYLASSQNPSRANVTLAMAGIYKVRVKVNGCESLEGSTPAITINSLDNVYFTYNPLSACAGSPNPTTIAPALATGSFTVSPNTGLTVSPTNGNINLAASTPKDDGPYEITFTSTGSCPSSRKVSFSYINNVDDDFSYEPQYCKGDPNDFPSFADTDGDNVDGIAGTFSANNSGLIFIDNNSGEIDFTNSTPGSYTITNQVNDCAGNPFLTPATFNIIIHPRPSTPSLSDVEVCEGEDIVVNPGAAAADYFWINPSGLAVAPSNISPTGVLTILGSTLADAGAYDLIIEDANGCLSNPATSNVIVNAIPAQPTPFNNGPKCEGSNLLLNANIGGMDAYNWSGPSYVSITQNPLRANATPSMSGTYSLTVMDNGCTSLPGTTDVTITPVPTQSVASNNGTPGICEGKALMLTTPTVPNASYSWQFPDGSIINMQNPSIPSVNPLDGGTYSLTVTLNACTSPVGTTNVIVNPLPAAPSASSNEPCEGDKLAFSATDVGVGAIYYWEGPNGYKATNRFPEIDTAIIIKHAGSYTVYAELDGCKGQTSLPINPVINQKDVADFSYALMSYCQTGSNALAEKDAAAAIGTFSAQPFGLNIDPQTGNVVLSNSIPGEYLVKYETTGNCFNQHINTLRVIAPPTAEFELKGSPYCTSLTESSLPVLKAGATAGVFRVSPAGLSIDSLTGKINPSKSIPATYTVSNYIAAANGCLAVTSPFEISVLNIDDASFSYAKDTYCISGIEAPIPTRAFPQGVFNSSPIGLSFNQATGSIDLSKSKPGIYTISYYTTGSVCSNSEEKTITIIDTPKTGFVYEKIYCKDTDAENPLPELQTGITSGGTFSGDGNNSSDISINPVTGEINIGQTKPGIYKVKYLINAAKGCAAASTIFPLTIEALPESKFDLSIDNVCVGMPVGLSYTGDPNKITQFDWNFGKAASKPGDDIKNYELTWAQSGLKTVTLNVQTDNCFSLPTQKTIMVNDYAIPAFDSDPLLPTTLVYFDEENPAVVKFTNKSSNATSYIWDFGDGSPKVTDKDPVHVYTGFDTPFMVTLTADNDEKCSAQSVVGPVTVSTKSVLDVPKAFSPNGDGENDVFIPVDLGIKDFSFQIYNRWGELIFHSTTKDIGWDGTFQTMDAPIGIYVYTLKGLSFDGKGVERKGLVLLKR